MTAVVATTRTTPTDTLFYPPSVVQPFISKEFSVYQDRNEVDVQFKNTIDKENRVHLVNTVNKLTGNISNKDTEIEASKFQDWIASHGGEQKLKAFLASTNHSAIIRRKRSTLSNISYSSDESSDDESDYIPISELKKGLATKERHTDNHHHHHTLKKPSWLTGLLQKKGGGILPSDTLPNKNTISAFFHPKKAAAERKKHIPPPLPQKQQRSLPLRYPFPIERAIQQISFMKLSNPKRPLRQHVLISNLLYQYTTTIQTQTAMLLNRSRKQSVVYSSIMQNNNQTCNYNIPPRKSSAPMVR